jgi:hypothetical protein
MSKNTNMNVVFHYDSGHGWLAARKEQVVVTGLSPKSFTSCSYIDSEGTLYLEQDLDATTFVNAAKTLGLNLIISSVDDGEYSKIRNLSRVAP